MSQSSIAKDIQKVHGTKVAARYLKGKQWPLYLAMFVLTGHFPKKNIY